MFGTLVHHLQHRWDLSVDTGELLVYNIYNLNINLLSDLQKSVLTGMRKSYLSRSKNSVLKWIKYQDLLLFFCLLFQIWLPIK